MQAKCTKLAQRRGFTLVELLVVLLIFGILTAIAVPSLISTQPQRSLAAAGDRFAQDFNYARAKAESTKNRVYIAFETMPDERQIEGRYNTVFTNLSAYPPPSNPGVARIARSYIIVEERPRYKTPSGSTALFGDPNFQGQPYTYFDWIAAYDAWDADPALNGYPVEPMFPFNATETALSTPGISPAAGPFNAQAVPLVLHYQDMINSMASLGGSTDLAALAGIYAGNHLNVTPDWNASNVNDQQFKVFCTQDQASILAMDTNNNRIYDDGIDDPAYNPETDTNQGQYNQVVDYVLLKRVTLPEHCVLVNPWKSSWVVGWEDLDGDDAYTAGTDRQQRQEMQFLQYLWAFNPPGAEGTFGGLKQAVWTYDPDPSATTSNHGAIRLIDSFEPSFHMWMTIQEVVDGEEASTLLYPALDPATANNPVGFGALHAVRGGSDPAMNLDANKKANLTSAARIFTFSTKGSKYYVDDYTPNDSALEIDDANANLNLNYVIPATGGNTEFVTPLRAREVAYSRNFLVP